MSEKKVTYNILPSYEQHKLKLIELDEIPKVVKDEFWGLVNRHIQLTDIVPQQIRSYRRKVRQILRSARWTSEKFRPIDTFFDEEQLEFLVSYILLPKSFYRGERELQVAEIKELRSLEKDEKEPSRGITAKIGKAFGRR